MKVKFLFAWYDLWVGAFWDNKKKWLYLLPLPCVGIIIKFKDGREDTRKAAPLIIEKRVDIRELKVQFDVDQREAYYTMGTDDLRSITVDKFKLRLIGKLTNYMYDILRDNPELLVIEQEYYNDPGKGTVIRFTGRLKLLPNDR